jgi:hypothetical protein
MDSFSNTTVPATPLPWVSALFQTITPSHTSLRAAVFTPASAATLKGVAQNNSPSDQGSPTTTMPSPVGQPQWPSPSAITAFVKSYASADPIEELSRSPLSHTDATGSSTGSCQIPPPAMLAGSRMPLDLGFHRKSFWLNATQTLG